MGFDAVTKNGSAASELRCDAHHCIMVWVSVPTAYKDVARMFVHHTRAPLDVVIPTTAKCAVVLGAVKDEPSVGANAPILDPLLRAAATRRWVGTKKRVPGRTKKLSYTKMDRTLAAPP